MDNTIISAIQEKKIIELNYHGLHRIVEPHVYGIFNGRECLVCETPLSIPNCILFLFDYQSTTTSTIITDAQFSVQLLNTSYVVTNLDESSYTKPKNSLV